MSDDYLRVAAAKARLLEAGPNDTFELVLLSPLYLPLLLARALGPEARR